MAMHLSAPNVSVARCRLTEMLRGRDDLRVDDTDGIIAPDSVIYVVTFEESIALMGLVRAHSADPVV